MFEFLTIWDVVCCLVIGVYAFRFIERLMFDGFGAEVKY